MACTRDEVLRDRFAELLNRYRTMVTWLVRGEQASGATTPEVDADALASSVIITALDGMSLHALAALPYDIEAAARTLRVRHISR